MIKQMYWNKGLHDAEIIGVNEVILDYDYTERVPLRNYLEIELNSKNALSDTTVKALRFYNFKILKGNKDVLKFWWYSDEIEEINGKYKLKIVFDSVKGKSEFEITCDKIEVLR